MTLVVPPRFDKRRAVFTATSAVGKVVASSRYRGVAFAVDTFHPGGIAVSNQSDTELHRVHTEFHRVDSNGASREVQIEAVIAGRRLGWPGRRKIGARLPPDCGLSGKWNEFANLAHIVFREECPPIG